MLSEGRSRLPRRPALIAGESTASFLVRLAAMNAMPFSELAGHVGGPRDLSEPDPRAVEVWLGPVARDHLVAVTGRSAQQLVRTLPTLARSKVTPKARRQIQVEPWPAGGEALPACALCMAGRALGLPVWRIRSPLWEVCGRHGRWAGPGPDGLEVDVTALPEVAAAHLRRVRLERAAGGYGRALVADAVQVAMYWWQCRQMGARGIWRHRQEALGIDRAALWAVPLVVYPEAVTVAEAMAVRERQRAVGRSFAGGPAGWTTGRWVRWVGERLGMEEEMDAGGHRALEAWLVAHRNTVPVVERVAAEAPPAGYRSAPLRMMAPHEQIPVSGPLAEASCLPWRLGSPMTGVPGRG